MGKPRGPQHKLSCDKETFHSPSSAVWPWTSPFSCWASVSLSIKWGQENQPPHGFVVRITQNEACENALKTKAHGHVERHQGETRQSSKRIHTHEEISFCLGVCDSRRPPLGSCHQLQSLTPAAFPGLDRIWVSAHLSPILVRAVLLSLCDKLNHKQISYELLAAFFPARQNFLCVLSATLRKRRRRRVGDNTAP